VKPAAFVVAVLTYLFNELQHLRRGCGFPDFEAPEGQAEHTEPSFSASDHVLVRSSGEIRATLNDQLEHRGMGFETDMLKHCGRRYCVQAEIRKVIDIVTGEMRTMKTPAYLLRGVHFSGERQFFNAQYEPLFWRSAWLQRDAETHPSAIEMRSAT
jgi:peptide methionine sulfoxide reductase MsrB